MSACEYATWIEVDFGEKFTGHIPSIHWKMRRFNIVWAFTYAQKRNGRLVGRFFHHFILYRLRNVMHTPSCRRPSPQWISIQLYAGKGVQCFDYHFVRPDFWRFFGGWDAGLNHFVRLSKWISIDIYTFCSYLVFMPFSGHQIEWVKAGPLHLASSLTLMRVRGL